MKKKDRNIIKVMNSILKAIPNDWDGKDALEHRILNMKTSLSYTAPELIPNFWYELSSLLQDHLSEIDLPWTRVVGQIIRGERE